MNVHKNARLTRLGRERLVLAMRSGQTPEAAARAAGVCPRTARKWLKRFEAEGPGGLIDRSSRPHKLRRPTPAAVQAEIVALRRQRLCARHIAKRVGVSPATVSRVLRAAGLSRMSDLDLVEPVRRYERATPGELIHIDIKKLGRIDGVGHRITQDRRGQSNRRGRGQGLGWEFAHVCVDDASRIAFAEMKRDETAASAVDFLKAPVAYYRSLGVAVARVMTDNGSCYKAFAFRDACRDLRLRHIRTKPYTPKTNGKAERFIQTALREWAYAKPYDHSDQRTSQLPQWLHDYNWHRPHGGIHAKTPTTTC